MQYNINSTKMQYITEKDYPVKMIFLLSIQSSSWDWNEIRFYWERNVIRSLNKKELFKYHPDWLLAFTEHAEHTAEHAEHARWPLEMQDQY